MSEPVLEEEAKQQTSKERERAILKARLKQRDSKKKGLVLRKKGNGKDLKKRTNSTNQASGSGDKVESKAGVDVESDELELEEPAAKVRRKACCALLAPSEYGDPVLCFSIEPSFRYLVSGTVHGKVLLWQCDQIIKSVFGTKTIAEVPVLDGLRIQENNENEFGEKVRKEKQHDEERKNVFNRETDNFESKEKVKDAALNFAFRCRILSKNSKEGICGISLDCKTGGIKAVVGDCGVKIWSSINSSKYEIKLESMLHSKPVFFDGSYISWLINDQKGGKILEILKLDSQESVARIEFPRQNHFYWGFQICDDSIGYVSNHRNIKVCTFCNGNGNTGKGVNGEDEKHEDSVVSALSSQESNRSTQTLTWKYKFTAKSSIVMFCLKKKYVYGITQDMKMKVWSLKLRKCIYTYYDLEGRFTLGVPYLMQIVTVKEGIFVVYSADDGIYCFKMLHTNDVVE